MNKFKHVVKFVMLVNTLEKSSTHVGTDLIILCAGSPYVDSIGLLHEEKENFDVKNGLFLGSTLRWMAAAKELEFNKYDRYILVGGYVDIDGVRYHKSKAMKLAIGKYCNITEELDRKIILLTSEPNTLGNCVTVEQFFKNTHYPKSLSVLTNEWHMERSMAFFNEYFLNKYVASTNTDEAETILNFNHQDCANVSGLTIEQYEKSLEDRIKMEQNGIQQYKNNEYAGQ